LGTQFDDIVVRLNTYRKEMTNAVLETGDLDG